MNNEPKGWRPDFTYTHRPVAKSPVEIDTKPSNAPLPRTMPNPTHQGTDIMHIVKSLRKYEHLIHRDMLLFKGGQTGVRGQLVWNIRGYRTVNQELTTGVYILPKELQWFIDNDNTEEALT